MEEKVIKQAYKKFPLDALVIQQGRLAEQKSNHFWTSYHICIPLNIFGLRTVIFFCAVVNKDKLLQMVRFGVKMVFSFF